MRVTIRRDGAATRLNVSGEVDIANAQTLDAQLRAAEVLPADALHVDLSGVEFMDAAGLRVVLHATERASAGRELHLIAVSPFVERLLNLLGRPIDQRVRRQRGFDREI